MTPLPTRLRASAQEMRSLESIVRVAPRIARELEEAAGALEAGPWIRTSDRRPPAGALIVKRWCRNGAVWAGIYSGTDKDSSFDEWIALPAPPSAQVAQEGGGVSASAYLAKVEADPRRAAALQRARDRTPGVATRHPRCGYPYCGCVAECFAASQPGAPGVMVDAAPQPTPYGLAGIEGDAIVIRLTADACAFAFANDPQAREPRPPVINKQQFLRDTLNELTAEREDGSTPLTDMLDRAMVKAMENGSDALDHDAAGVATDGGDDADH